MQFNFENFVQIDVYNANVVNELKGCEFKKENCVCVHCMPQLVPYCLNINIHAFVDVVNTFVK